MASLSNINGIFDVHSTGAIQFNGNHGTAGQILKSNGNAAPTWIPQSDIVGAYLPLAGGTLTGATATASGISFTVGGTLTGTSATFSGNVTAATFNTLPIETARNDNANRIVRTNVHGYVDFGWINTTSGATTSTVSRIYASNDAYIRYVTPATFRTQVTDPYYAPAGTVSGVTSVTAGNGLAGGTITTTGTLSTVHLPSFDTRNSNPDPEDYNNLIRFDFKHNSTNGLYDGGTYNGQMTWRAYGGGSDMSGGYPVRLAYTANGNLWRQMGTSATSWGDWNKFAIGTGTTAQYIRGDASLATFPTIPPDPTGVYLPLAGGIMSGNIGRSAYNSGYQVGGYNNIGASHAKTNPIHAIGTNYLPTANSLSDMYGIGYTRGDTSFMGVAQGSGWGLYVASDGDARIFLDSSAGDIYASNKLCVNAYANQGGGLLFSAGQTTGTTRSLNLRTTNVTSDPSSVDGSDATGITWGQRTDGNPYYIIKPTRLNFGGGNYSKLTLNWHTGIRIGGGKSYGGTKFYNDAPDIVGETGVIMNVGVGNDNIGVVNALTVGGAVTWSGGGSAESNAAYDNYASKTYNDAARGHLGGYYTSGGTEKPNASIFGPGKARIAMLGSGNLGFGGPWNDVFWMSAYSGGDVKRSTAIVSSKYDNTSVWVVKQNYDSSSWGTGYLFWNSGNFTPGNYLPLSGGTVTGTLTVSSTLTTNSQITANSSIYLKNQLTLPASGLSNTSGRPAYAIYQESGAWSHPYPDLCLAMHTGIKLGANASYNGIRFYDDYTMATQVMAVNDSSSPIGAGHVYVNNVLQAGASLRAPIFYDTNTTYYGDFASTSNMNALTLVGTFSGQNGYFNQDLAVGFNSGNIGGKLNIQINSANGIGIKNNINGKSGATGLLQYTSASYASGGYNMVFQAVPPSGSDSNMLLCYLNGNIVNRFNSYGQYSDRKLKENIVDTTPKLEDVKKIRIRNFNFKDDPYKQIGVIAQEFEEVFPGLVEDKEVPDQDETTKTVKYSVLVPILVKAIQELEARVKELENK